MKLKDKNEQRLSLNGSFGMLTYLMGQIDNKEITTIEEMKDVLLLGMKGIHQEITKLENSLDQ
jgi:hypothetical protein